MDHDILRPYVYCLVRESGFNNSEYAALETLTEMLQSLITEIGHSTKSFAEAAGRIYPLPADVQLALCDLGVRADGLGEFAARQKLLAPRLTHSHPAKPLSMLASGTKQQLPSYLPAHLPQLPDSHAYTRTPTHKKPVTEYEAIREKVASQKRDLERALNRFNTSTNELDSLFFNDEGDLFPLIAAKPQCQPYLTALLPKDQVYDDDEDEINSQISKKVKSSLKKSQDPNDENNSKADEAECEAIDNPYLRPVKLHPK